MGFSGDLDGKESAYKAGDPGSISELQRSLGEGNGYPLQYSCLENSMDRRAWWATVHRVTKSWTQLHNWSNWPKFTQLISNAIQTQSPFCFTSKVGFLFVTVVLEPVVFSSLTGGTSTWYSITADDAVRWWCRGLLKIQQSRTQNFLS